jgi:hypothetical protein
MHSESTKLRPADLLKLEDYAAQRKELRDQVLAYKRHRTLALGPNVTLSFENRHTIRYQVQEMLRIEKIFEPRGIQDELDAYNPLIPDGSNWKASCFIEFPDEKERRQALVRLREIERMFWVQVAELPRVPAMADEDLERSNEDKTSAVHFLRFELDARQVEVVRAGGTIQFGVDHPAYSHKVLVPLPVRESLLADLA